MRVTERFAGLPLWVRVLCSVAGGAALGAGCGLATGPADRAVLWAVVGAVMGGAGQLTAHRRRAKLADDIGFVGDLDQLDVVRRQVEAGRVPTDTYTQRELARRYTSYQQRLLWAQRLLAVVWTVLGVAYVALLVAEPTGLHVLSATVWLLGAVVFARAAWLQPRRYRQVFEVLGYTDRDWTAQAESRS
ncbi:hypothetical protein [Rhodococcus sp. X156]|uniref:hypothetical protein n=1 Tax=Rhodococcus sp. X156 TaxID=2499145 RepID=UPI000FDB1ECA|nr:hypothetical protein [Rhodococcus sp. X156]